MKKYWFLLLFLAVGLGGLLLLSNNKTPLLGGGYTPVGINVLDNLKYFSTTTGSQVSTSCPVRLLSSASSRQYAVITNNSDTGIYIYLSKNNLCCGNETTTLDSSYDICNGSTTSGFLNLTRATSTIDSLDGIYVASTGGSFTIDLTNQFSGEIWVTSTGISKEIDVFYQQ